MVLERDQRDRQARVAAEPELQRDVQRASWGARARRAGVRQLSTRAGLVQRIAVAVLHQDQVVAVAHHLVERADRARILRQLRPDLHPVAVLAVNALAADLKLNRLDQAVAHVVEPAEALDVLRHRRVRRAQVNRRENHLHVRAVHQIGVAVDDGRHALVEVGLAVERHLNGLHGEVRVALEQHLPERDLRVAADVDILRTIAHELKKTTTHIAVMFHRKKKVWARRLPHKTRTTHSLVGFCSPDDHLTYIGVQPAREVGILSTYANGRQFGDSVCNRHNIQNLPKWIALVVARQSDHKH